MIEVTGVLATILIFVSFLFSDIKKIRFLNLLGSILFALYGYWIGATWTWVLNVGLIFIQLYFLHKLSRNKEKE